MTLQNLGRTQEIPRERFECVGVAHWDGGLAELREIVDN